MNTYDDPVHMMQEFGGLFVSLIAKAWDAADPVNRQKLETCFSEYFNTYEKMHKKHLKRVSKWPKRSIANYDWRHEMTAEQRLETMERRWGSYQDSEQLLKTGLEQCDKLITDQGNEIEGMKAKESFAISGSRMVRDYENPQMCFYAIPARYLTDTEENLDFCLAIGGAKLLEGLKSNN